MSAPSKDTPAEIVLPPKPVMPREEDCCHSDCVNCVFNNYERELERWEEQVAALLKKNRPPA